MEEGHWNCSVGFFWRRADREKLSFFLHYLLYLFVFYLDYHYYNLLSLYLSSFTLTLKFVSLVSQKLQQMIQTFAVCAAPFPDLTVYRSPSPHTFLAPSYSPFLHHPFFASVFLRGPLPYRLSLLHL